MSTIVAIGCSTHWDYSLLLPVGCLLWRDLVGHEPRAILVGREGAWERDPVAVEALGALERWGVEYVRVPSIAGHLDSTVAQSVRQHAATDPSIVGDVWVMMSDADLWPLRRDFYWQHERSGARAACYFWNAAGFSRKEAALAAWDARQPFDSIPTCHVAMRASDWRALYGYASSDVGEALRATLDGVLAPRLAGRDPSAAATESWYHDQHYLTERLCRQDWFPGDALLISRQTQYERGHLVEWDRGGGWDGGFNASWTDAHIRHGIYAERRWEVLLPVVDCLLPDWGLAVREYFERAVRCA